MNSDPILLAVDSLSIGGMERQVVELVRGLKQSGRFPVVLALLDHGGDLERAAVEAAAGVLPLSRKARFDCTPALFLIWRARRAGIRLIHAFGWMSALAGLLAARCLRVPIINGSIRQAPPVLGLCDQVTRWCARRSDWIVANSRAGLEAYGLSDHPRAQVIVNGIDFTRFDDVIAEHDGEPTVCMVANFSARKDHATMIRALPCIRQAVPRARLVLVGKDEGTLADNRRLAYGLGLSEAVLFITNSLRPEPFIAGSQVCVLVSPSEGFSNAILEYMALGKPVVATVTCGDSALLVSDGENGFLVPRSSPQVLAARVIELLRDPERARLMGEAGRQQVQALTVPRMVAAYEALYDQLLRPRCAV
jgi:glycosyltransferase involved in cell wall biosynthesis